MAHCILVKHAPSKIYVESNIYMLLDNAIINNEKGERVEDIDCESKRYSTGPLILAIGDNYVPVCFAHRLSQWNGFSPANFFLETTRLGAKLAYRHKA